MTQVETIKKCPYCYYQDTVRNFSEWEKNEKRGTIGTTDGFMILMCPKCENHIKYDCSRNLFMRLDQNASFINTKLLKLLLGWGLLVFAVWLFNKLI
jgi:hypothetical protein